MRVKKLIFYFVVFFLSRKVKSIEIMSKDKKDFQFINFYQKPGLVLLDSLVKKVQFTDLASCQSQCVSHKSCLSVNFGYMANQTVCELNNATSLAKPLKMRKRKEFQFYGPADPCFSTPCLNGGTCESNTTSQGSYKCNCGHQVALVPYTNDHCAIDETIKSSELKKPEVFNGVFHVRYSKHDRYQWNYYDAERVCQMYGAGLANLQQLTAAWRIGYDMCSFGWLVDGTVRYPIFSQSHNGIQCGSAPPNIRGDRHVKDKSIFKSGGYCYKETDRCNEVNWYQNGRKCYRFFLDSKASWNKASATCAKEGGQLGVMNAKAKLLFVKDFIEKQKSSVEQIMVGLRQDNGGMWEWNDGTSVDSSLWNITQPSGPIGTVDMRTTSLNRVPEKDELSFVCQKDIQS